MLHYILAGSFAIGTLRPAPFLITFMLLINPSKLSSVLTFAHEFIYDIVKGMKTTRPGRIGVSVFPKWSLEGLLRYLISPVFEPLERASFDIVRSKSLTLLCLATGRRVCEIAAISSVSFGQSSWNFMGSLNSWSKRNGFWEMEVRSSQNHSYRRAR